MTRHLAPAAVLVAVVLTGCGGSPPPASGQSLAAGGDPAAAGTGPPVRSSTAEYRVREPVTRLRVAGLAGRIDVTGSARQDIAVIEDLRFAATPPQTRHAVAGDTLSLDYSCPDGGAACWVGYRVEVPHGTRVDLRSSAGGITVADLTGELRAETTAGPVVGTGLRGPQATVTSLAGSVTLGFAAAPALVVARTTAGPVTVRLPTDRQYAVTAGSVAGGVQVGVPQDAGSAHRVDASSSAGRVRVLGP